MRKKEFVFLIASLLLTLSCSYDRLEPLLDCENRLYLELVRVENSSCSSDRGELEVKVTEASRIVGDLKYSINGGATFQSSGFFSGLGAGDYTILVSDDECSGMLRATLINEDGIKASISGTTSKCGQNTAIVTVDVNTAIGAVQYSIDGGSKQTESSFSGVSTGEHTVVAIDESGCSIELTIEIMSDVSYTNVESIIRSSCALSGCHAGNIAPDFRVKSNILNSAGSIRNRVSRGTMPPRSSGIQLSSLQVESIECWVKDGAQG